MVISEGHCYPNWMNPCLIWCLTRIRPRLRSRDICLVSIKGDLHSWFSRALHTWYSIQRCAVQRGILTVGRELIWCRLYAEYHIPHTPLLIPSSERAVNNVRMESPVARTGQHPWLRPRWIILPTRMGYCSKTIFRCGDYAVDCMHVNLTTIACGRWGLVID